MLSGGTEHDMTVNLSGRNFLKLLDFTPEEITYLVDLSAELKRMKRAGEAHRYLEGKNIVLLFEKTSTRTRCSFEVAGHDLGMGVTYLDPASSQMGKKESIEDTARVLGRMFDGIEYRGYGQEIVETLAANAGVPVWNGLTDEFHPTQMIADMLTLREEFGDIRGRKLTFMGDARNNVANSLMVVCAKLGLDFCACGPAEQMPEESLVSTCRAIAAENGCTITLTSDVTEGAANADVMALAKDTAIFLHCLPSYHDTNTTTGAQMAEKFGITEMEVTDEVFESAQSRVFDEAENRMHSIKAVMYATLVSPAYGQRI